MNGSRHPPDDFLEGAPPSANEQDAKNEQVQNPIDGDADQPASRVTTSPREAIEAALRLMFRAGDVFEVRALNLRDRPGSTRKTTGSGYFMYQRVDEAARLIAELDAQERATGIYVTINPVNPALVARADHRINADAKQTTSDADVTRRRWLPIDIDPVRPSGISSSNEEHALAEQRARDIVAYLRDLGWPEPVVADSGNGFHVLYAIDLAVDEDGLVQRVLEALADRFDDDCVKIDRKVFNPARIWKAYGTVARKGDPTDDRPHRRAQIRQVPVDPVAVPIEMLTALGDIRAANAPPTSESAASAKGPSASFDLPAWLARSRLTYSGPTPWRDKHGQPGERWALDVCPWNSEHADRSAFVVRFANGAISAGCHHNGCAGKGWHELRDIVEPGWRSRAGHGRAGASVGCVSDSGGGAPNFWLDPQPLPDALLPVMAFDPYLLPVTLGPWVVDIAERIQCPIDFSAVAAMVALGAVVGRRIGIRPKRYDDWIVPGNLWGGVIGRPGVMKTPAIQEPLKPLKKLEILAKAAFEQQFKDMMAAKQVSEIRKKDTRHEIRKNIKNQDEAFRIARESLDDEDDAREPVRTRFIVNDGTVEKIGVILNENPAGVLVFRDELIGLLKALDKPGQEGARSFYLESWNGTGRYTYDRIERGTLDIEAAILSLLGGIQPGPLSQYLRGAAKGGAGDDGLIQRFQLLVWPDISKDWKNIDRWPDSAARRAAFDVYEGLAAMEPTLLGADHDPREPDGIPFLRFSEAAQPCFDAWREKLEHIVRGGDLHPALESHLSKFRSLIPKLALLIHLAEGKNGPVGIESLDRAIRWGQYLESHARRVYSQVIDPDLAAAKSLAGKLVAGEIKDGFALRDIYRKGWTGLASEEDARGAVEYLIDFRWLAEARRETAGRTASVYFVNPKITCTRPTKFSRPPSGGTDKGDRSPPSHLNKDPSVSSVSTDEGTSPEFQSRDEPLDEPDSPQADGEEDGSWTG
ncbi:MAG: YfjI family protein [Phycisphaerales bacterium]